MQRERRQARRANGVHRNFQFRPLRLVTRRNAFENRLLKARNRRIGTAIAVVARMRSVAGIGIGSRGLSGAANALRCGKKIRKEERPGQKAPKPPLLFGIGALLGVFRF